MRSGLLTEEAAGLTIQCQPWHEMLTYPSPSWKFMFSFLLLPINSERHKKNYFSCTFDVISLPLSLSHIYICIYTHNTTNHVNTLQNEKGNSTFSMFDQLFHLKVYELLQNKLYIKIYIYRLHSNNLPYLCSKYKALQYNIDIDCLNSKCNI